MYKILSIAKFIREKIVMIKIMAIFIIIQQNVLLAKKFKKIARNVIFKENVFNAKIIIL